MSQHGNSVNALAIAPSCGNAKPPIADDPGAFLVGAHPLMQRIIALVRRVAVTDATVLITGESGTGKEVVARKLKRTTLVAKLPNRSLRKEEDERAWNHAAP